MSLPKKDQPLASTERSDLSATNHGAVHSNPASLNPARPGAIRGTVENDAAMAQLPQLGDSVRVDVDRVPFMEQTEVHQRIRATSVHGRLGMVVGSKVVGSSHYLTVDTGTGVVDVPADCVALEAPVVESTPEMQDSSRTSPEKMHKHASGSYNLT